MKILSCIFYFSCFLFFCLLAAFAVLAQDNKPITNDDIVQMMSAGFEEETIIKAIQANDTSFDTSIHALVVLKNAGLSEKIIAAMLDSRASSESAAPSSTVPNSGLTTANNPPAAAKEAEVWPEEVAGMAREIGIHYKEADKFVTLYGRPIVATKTGGFFKSSLTMGIAKVRMKAQLSGKQAQLQVSDRTPVFYFYLEQGQTPGAFVIVKMETKGDRREFEVGSAGGLTGSYASGLDAKKTIQIAIERIAPQLYRVRPNRELDDGEYAFVGTFTYAAAGLGGSGEQTYDFGVPKRR